jgi:hypothetical protein
MTLVYGGEPGLVTLGRDPNGWEVTLFVRGVAGSPTYSGRGDTISSALAAAKPQILRAAEQLAVERGKNRDYLMGALRAATGE